MNDDIFNVEQAYRLDNPGRIDELKPLKPLRDTAGIQKEYTCIDFGSGTGAFALPMAELVGDKGKVYAIDNSAKMMEHINAKNPPPHLIPIQSDVERTGLNNNIADICLLAFILHEAKQPENLIKEAHRLLESGGSLVIVEWNADLDSPGPPRKNRIPQQQVEQLLHQVSLILTNNIEWNKNHYVVIGNKEMAPGGF